jgi:TonB-dependent starch-binding outer membrane protein SusC
MKYLFMLLMGLLLTGSVAAQRVVSGTVTDAADGSSLPGVSIALKGGTGTVTDQNGRFSLSNAPRTGTLLITYTGYTAQEIALDERNQYNIQLVENTSLIDEVIVVGYGEQRRGNLTTSISSIKGNDINRSPVSSVESALQGRAAGVLVNNSSGQPGSGLRVNIRGASSINAGNSPLFVVDGIPMVSESNSALFTGGYTFNSMADIAPADIESIDILKDASAAAIYGSRGANGVVLITTKRGKEGKGSVGFEVNRGFQNPTNTPQMLNSKDFINLMNEAAKNDGLAEDWFSNPANGNLIGNPNDPNLVNTDWYGEILNRNAPVSNYTLSARGGGNRTSYYVSASYFDQTGIVKGSDYDRVSARSNFDVQVNDRVKIGTTAFISRSNIGSVISDNSLYGVLINTLAADPTMPVFNDEGDYSNPFIYYSWWALENPRASTDLYDRNTNSNRFLGSVYGEVNITNHLKFRSVWSSDYQFVKDELFYPSNTGQARSGSIAGLGQYGSTEALTWVNENLLSWQRTLRQRHNVGLLAGYTMQETRKDLADITGENFANDQLRGLGLAADITNASTSAFNFGLDSWIGRVNYDLDNKYYLTASVRADGSSKFGKNNRYGVFPSFSAAWRVSGESFMKSLNWLYDLKLRASYGVTGNQEGIGAFASRTLWSAGSDYNGQPGTSPATIGNGDLTWESTTQLNGGLDLSLVQGRISLTADYFIKRTNDLLLATPVPPTSGFSSITRNIGAMENKGIELALNTTNVKRGGFIWETSFNISQVRNKVVTLQADDQLLGNFGVSHILKEGYPVGTFHLINFEGVDPATGDAKFTDVNGDGAINSDDSQVVEGKSFWPDWFGGFGNRLSYKGFELNAFFQFSVGNYLWNHGRYTQEQMGWTFDFGGFYLPYGNTTQYAYDNRWQQAGDETDIPRAGLGRRYNPDGTVASEYQNWQEFSTQWLEDASYLRLKTIELAYNLPLKSSGKLKMPPVRVYVQGQNLLTFTGYRGMDPETSSNGERVLTPGEDFGGIGQAKTIMFGLKLGL